MFTRARNLVSALFVGLLLIGAVGCSTSPTGPEMQQEQQLQQKETWPEDNCNTCAPPNKPL